ncbi:TPA: RtcB family protein, partial [Candidatus Bipolaricaulota bacterium]|nr:RtcB family protein [Candidatus Bipolaricaulota bacterium]
VPAGLGSTGKLKLTERGIDQVLVKGAYFALEQGFGVPEDLEYIEEGGRMEGADPAAVSFKAKQRQFKQVGTLGSGNHYLEVQYVEEVYDPEAAAAYGIEEGQILVAIHCGSRALGHQIGQDSLQELERASKKYGIPIRERELVCAPIKSPEGQKYLSAVFAGINCAFANRQVIAHLVREALAPLFGLPFEKIRTLYDVGHNNVKFERHKVDGEEKELLVHRKGSTRAFGPGRPECPERYRKVGHPIFVGGTMGTSSYILRGTELGMERVWGSGVHGAGRALSRKKAKKQWRGEKVVRELAAQGIVIRAHSAPGVAEEAPGAYKDVDLVVKAAVGAGLNAKVARVRPLVCIKG